MMNIDFHVHTKYSFDSYMNINKIIKIAKIRNLSGIVICDHDRFSYPKLKKEIKQNLDDFILIPGMEIKTDFGDLIGMRINESITSTNFFECVDEIKDKSGISILPHPYRRLKNVDIKKLGKCVDWIERFNSRSTVKQNNKAIELSKALNKPEIVGSDAHLYNEIGRSYVSFKKICTVDDIYKEIISKNVNIVSTISPRRVHYWSSLYGAIRTRNVKPLISGLLKEIRSGFK